MRCQGISKYLFLINQKISVGKTLKPVLSFNISKGKILLLMMQNRHFAKIIIKILVQDEFPQSIIYRIDISQKLK